MTDTFQKKETTEEVIGVTIIVDGVIKIAFDQIKTIKNYEAYHQVLRDIVFAGVQVIIKEEAKKEFKKKQ